MLIYVCRRNQIEIADEKTGKSGDQEQSCDRWLDEAVRAFRTRRFEDASLKARWFLLDCGDARAHQAWTIAGVSSCTDGRGELAKDALEFVTKDEGQEIEKACFAHGILLRRAFLR
jgi:hypothetical protein